jgi:hypothetical protein
MGENMTTSQMMKKSTKELKKELEADKCQVLPGDIVRELSNRSNGRKEFASWVLIIVNTIVAVAALIISYLAFIQSRTP